MSDYSTRRNDPASLERLQISQSDRLPENHYSFWFDPDPIATFLRMLLPSAGTGAIAASLQWAGFPLIPVIFFAILYVGVILYIWRTFKDAWQRLPLLVCLWIGFSFSINWGLIFNAI